MGIYEKIRKDIIIYFKNSNNKNKSKELKIILGELQRQPNKNITDKDLIRVLKRRIKELNEIIGIINQNKDKMKQSEKYINNLKETIKFLETYIPENLVIDNTEIENYIKSINFNKLKNYKQAIGIVRKHFTEKYPNKELDMNEVCRLVDKYGKD